MYHIMTRGQRARISLGWEAVRGGGIPSTAGEIHCFPTHPQKRGWMGPCFIPSGRAKPGGELGLRPDEEVPLSSCFPRSQNRDRGHPSVVQNQAVRALEPKAKGDGNVLGPVVGGSIAGARGIVGTRLVVDPDILALDKQPCAARVGKSIRESRAEVEAARIV